MWIRVLLIVVSELVMCGMIGMRNMVMGKFVLVSVCIVLSWVCVVGVFGLIVFCSLLLYIVIDICIFMGICCVVFISSGMLWWMSVFLVRIDIGVLEVVRVLMIFGMSL